MSRKISIILDQTDRYFTDYYNNLYRVDVHCSRCTDISGEVVSLARVASNFENKITSSVQPTASFVPFARLPAELQVMIWEKAAQPPACPHYFSTFDPNRAGHDPAAAARLMADYGLWTANLSSRATMLRLYGKVFKNCDANKIQCHEICKNDELPSRQLGGILAIADKIGSQSFPRFFDMLAVRYLNTLCADAYARLRQLAKNAGQFETEIASQVQPTARFVSFEWLPAELQLMIWEKAVQPPSCSHFFDTFGTANPDRVPTTRLLVDHGLWTATVDSRAVMEKAYGKAKEQCCENPCHKPWEYGQGVENRNQELGWYNRDVWEFPGELQFIMLHMSGTIWVADKVFKVYVARSSCSELAKLADAIKAKFPCITRPGWSLADNDMPFHANRSKIYLSMLL
ncbi:hypothetical protein SBRCBS47491_008644 [Sporothrix bragantina]|uniref:Integrase catalytic domain-containing protein n=1 Tax=Sporothrix bragantina TaxID=671064 RepID=A0ABP0CPN9_9PEZI